MNPNFTENFDEDNITVYYHPDLKAVRILTVDDPEYGRIQYWKDNPIPMTPYTVSQFKFMYPDIASSYFG